MIKLELPPEIFLFALFFIGVILSLIIDLLIKAYNYSRQLYLEQKKTLTTTSINAPITITDKPEPIHRVTIDGIVYKCLVHPSDCKHKYEAVKNGLTKIKVCVGCGLTKDEVKKYIEESNLHCDHVYLPTAEGMELSTGYYACIKCGLLIDKETYKEYSHAVR